MSDETVPLVVSGGERRASYNGHGAHVLQLDGADDTLGESCVDDVAHTPRPSASYQGEQQPLLGGDDAAAPTSDSAFEEEPRWWHTVRNTILNAQRWVACVLRG